MYSYLRIGNDLISDIVVLYWQFNMNNRLDCVVVSLSQCVCIPRVSNLLDNEIHIQ